MSVMSVDRCSLKVVSLSVSDLCTLHKKLMFPFLKCCLLSAAQSVHFSWISRVRKQAAEEAFSVTKQNLHKNNATKNLKFLLNFLLKPMSQISASHGLFQSLHPPHPDCIYFSDSYFDESFQAEAG